MQYSGMYTVIRMFFLYIIVENMKPVTFTSYPSKLLEDFSIRTYSSDSGSNVERLLTGRPAICHFSEGIVHIVGNGTSAHVLADERTKHEMPLAKGLM
jgi:hypothetical protein